MSDGVCDAPFGYDHTFIGGHTTDELNFTITGSSYSDSKTITPQEPTKAKPSSHSNPAHTPAK
jgi:hypothetical protein